MKPTYAGIAYREGIIHADLSEYNIMMEDGRCVIIDWPQWVATTHINAQTILNGILKISSPILNENITWIMIAGMQCDA